MRTEVNLIALKLLFALSLLLIIAIDFNHLYKNVTYTIIGDISDSIKSGSFTSLTAEQILISAQEIKNRNFFAVLIFTTLVTLLFSYFISRVTLSPARNALKSQKRFISDVAHELRTPISIIKTDSEVALFDKDLDPDTRKLLKSNIEELDRVSNIINNLLSLNNLINPERISFGGVDLELVIDESIKKLDTLARNKKIEITLKKTQPLILSGNITALEQIVTNILKNAITYTSAGGKITITAEPDFGGNVILTIKDNGIGIDQKDLYHIFEPFYRAESSRKRHIGGSSGLGLTIVSELVKLHSGKVSIRSAVDRGTTVSVIFPYGQEFSPTERRKVSEVSLNFLDRRSH